MKQVHLLAIAVAMILIPTTGCRHLGKSIVLPKAPDLPYLYSQKDYDHDLAVYEKYSTSTSPAEQILAQDARNSIAWGLMGTIDDLYNNYSANLYSGKGAIAIAGDTASLGLTAAVAIARQTAAKTLFGALGTAITGVNLSIDKNLFAQQTFQIIAIAMETRRTALYNVISNALQKTVHEYPLSAVKRDLVLYLSAGSLPGGLQETQREAGAASAATDAKTPQPAGAPTQRPGQPGANQPLDTPVSSRPIPQPQ